jgi:hypothetical protein
MDNTAVTLGFHLCRNYQSVKQFLSLLLLFFASYTALLAQSNGTVAGKIVDEKTNTVLPGVTITVNKPGVVKSSDLDMYLTWRQEPIP